MSDETSPSFFALFFASRVGVVFMQLALWAAVPRRRPRGADDKVADDADGEKDAAPASGRTSGTKKRHAIGRVDLLFIGINQFVETTFLAFLLRVGAALPDEFEGVSSPSVILTVLRAAYLAGKIAFGALLLLFGDDFLYEPFHRFLHTNKILYTLVHAHHHKNRWPTRGYLDAVNENPLEMAGALLLNAAAILVARPILTRAALAIFVGAKAAFAIINHLGRNVSIAFYNSNRHAKHHLFSVVHFGQL